MQADLIQTQGVDNPATVGITLSRPRKRAARHIGTDGIEHHLFAVELSLNQHVVGRYAVERERPGAHLDLRIFPQYVPRLGLPRADATGHLLRTEIPLRIRAVKGHVIQLQTVGLERQRRRLWR